MRGFLSPVQQARIPPTLCPGHACKRRGSHTPCRRTAIGSRVESISVSVQTHGSVALSSSQPPLSVVQPTCRFPPWARRAEELARRMNRSKIWTGQNHDWAYYSLHPVPMGLPGRRSYAGYGEKHFALAEKKLRTRLGRSRIRLSR